MKKKKKLQCITFTWKRKRYYCYGKTLAQAGEKLEKLKRELKTGNTLDEINITLERYFIRWSMGREGVVRPSTERSVNAAFKRISSYIEKEGDRRFGLIRINEIESESVVRLQKHLADNYSSSTANSTMGLLKRILTGAMNDGYITANPCAGLKNLLRSELPAREGIHRALSREETKEFFKAAKDSRYYELYLFLINTGVRCGEAGALYLRDIKDEVLEIRRTVTRTKKGYIIGDDVKTGAGRRDIPVTRELRRIISGQKKRNNKAFGYQGDMRDFNTRLFCSPRGSLLIASNVDQDIKRICKKAGIKYFTAHAFRDTFATRAIESGMNPKTLQEILGHSSYSITMNLYAHVMPSTKAEEMGRVSFI